MSKISVKLLLFIVLFIFSICLSANVEQVAINYPKNFQMAKHLAKKIFADNQSSFYCGCSYNADLVVDWESCGYKPRKNKRRAIKIEWEHVVAAEFIARQMLMNCWDKYICTHKNGNKYKGRECCLKANPLFKAMHNDLHNLVPSIGEINLDRKNYNFGIVTSKINQYGKCDVKIDFKSRIIEPPNRLKGVVARIYLYYLKEYGINLTQIQLNLFNHWNRTYPPENWELKWNEKVRNIQGNSNIYISDWYANLY